MAELIPFEQALNETGEGKRHLLLGNGFSIACRSNIFRYQKLFEQADFTELPGVKEAFTALGTTDFERMIHALQDYQLLAGIYSPTDLSGGEQAKNDAAALRELLVRTIAQSHPARPSDIEPSEYRHAKVFLSHFDRIYTVNYDLLLYWTLMQDEIEPQVACDDGFRKGDDPHPAYVTWEPDNTWDQNVYYLHGAMHLFDAGAELQKYTWTGTGVPLIEQIRAALEANKFPLFVSEATSKEKVARIRHHDYLAKAHRSIRAIQGSLFVYGLSLSDNDDHILKAIEKSKVSALYIGLNSGLNSESSKRIIRRATDTVNRRPARKPLALKYFDASAVPVWRD